jgi:hypothetical protein
MRSIQALGLASSLRRLGGGLGMLSGPPGTRFGRHLVGEMNSSRNQGVSLQPGNLGVITAGGGGAPDVGAVESVVGGGGAVDVGAVASVVGVGVSFQKPRLRGTDDRDLRGRGGDCSGELSLVLRSAPHPQTTPLSSTALQRLRARIGRPQRRHQHKQWSGSRPHRPPLSLACLTWGHMRTLALDAPQYLELAERPS